MPARSGAPDTHPDGVWTSRRISSRVFRRVASSVGKRGRCSSVTSRGEARGCVSYKPHAVPGPPSESPPSFSLQSGKGLSSRRKC